MRKRKRKEKIVPVVTAEEWNAEFMQRIKHLRETRFGTGRGGKSNASRAIGVTPSDWAGYERGVMPGADKLQKMCEAFDCNANWLLGVEIDEKRHLTHTQEKAVDTLIEVQQAIHAFDDALTEALLGLRDILSDPESTQAQCTKLYDIARRLKRLRRECEREPVMKAAVKGKKKIAKKIRKR